MALWVVKSRPVPIYLIQPEWQTGTKICSSFVLTYLFLTFLSYIRNLQWFLYFKVLRELQPSKGLAKGPIRRNNIVGDESAPALVVTLKERLCPLWQGLLCQFWSQLLDMGNQPVFDPLIESKPNEHRRHLRRWWIGGGWSTNGHWLSLSCPHSFYMAPYKNHNNICYVRNKHDWKLVCRYMLER